LPRRRGLSPDERALWAEVAATTTPLHATVPLPEDPARAPAPPDPAVAPKPAAPPALAARRIVPTPDLLATLDRAHPHMDRRRFEKLRRGRLEPEARVDLHGMTSERAHAVLGSFIRSAQGDGLRLVLVITGKGAPDDSPHQPRRHGILRHSVPHWLAAPPLSSGILQVTPAHPRHGGAGALYVYLRRHR
jgi:DNA-nicking Smr family endonuclease